METLPAETTNIFLTTDCLDLEPLPNIEVEQVDRIELKKINEEKESNF